MRQRIMLASVMLLRPALLIADEPTTALDCLAQLDVIELMLELTREQGTAILFISHDLSLVARYAHKVVVMRHGQSVEQGTIQDILLAPKAEYTRQLLEALPRRGELAALPGQHRARGGSRSGLYRASRADLVLGQTPLQARGALGQPGDCTG